MRQVIIAAAKISVVHPAAQRDGWRGQVMRCCLVLHRHASAAPCVRRRHVEHELQCGARKRIAASPHSHAKVLWPAVYIERELEVQRSAGRLRYFREGDGTGAAREVVVHVCNEAHVPQRR